MLNNGLRMIFRLFLNNFNSFINSNCINRNPIIVWINTWTWIDKQQWKIRLIVFPLYIFFIIVGFVWWFKKVWIFFFKSFNSMRKARLSNCDKNTFYFPGLYGYDCIKTYIKWTHRPLFMSFLCVCSFKIFQTTTFLVSIFYSDDSYYNSFLYSAS